MKKWQNMGGLDRVIRVIVSVVLVLLGFYVEMSVVVSTIIFVIAAVLLLTAIFGICLTYIPFRINTQPKTRGTA
jgi:hypothetical protein